MLNIDALKQGAVAQYNFWQQLAALDCVKAIYLYGSRARGDFTKMSDIDIALAYQSKDNKNWLRILDIIDDADTLLDIDCVRLDQVDKDLLSNINQDRKIIYEQR
jgi:uncharacterized protein